MKNYILNEYYDNILNVLLTNIILARYQEFVAFNSENDAL